ncbi:restriction endonuclease [Streptomyces phaeolivaceus]|uniref:Restriction endonuclease n=1 Tax=Streptomyces phaeolivaceus TaxID=2653200 RepID=A0A5P8KF82_9ACTN|nr:restriction endonuclease [Streptomyces phaeolivaceus]QFR02004.1 restriction endonuclease [Streptomyces phaeolivaceus]
MSRLACPLCGQQVAANRQGLARHQRADGEPCLPDDDSAPAIGTPAVGCGAVALSVVAAVVFGSWPLLWVCLLVSAGVIVWRANLSPAARIAAADRRAVQAVAQGATTADTGPPVRDVEAEAKRLLEELPPLGATVEDAVAAGMARLRPFDPQPLKVRFTKLARAHVAADERILGLAVGPDQGPSGGGRVLAVVTDRALVVKDRDVVYRDDTPETQPGAYGYLASGARTFSFSTNHGLETAVAARALAAASPRRTAVAPSGRPPERLIREARDAELSAAEWMRHLGFADAVATPVGADGGVDVVSARAVAQVELEGKPTGRPTVQQLHGVAAQEKKTGVFFSVAGYTPQARTWAQTSGTLLFRFDRQGAVEAVNAVAHELLAEADARADTGAEAGADTGADAGADADARGTAGGR